MYSNISGKSSNMQLYFDETKQIMASQAVFSTLLYNMFSV